MIAMNPLSKDQLKTLKLIDKGILSPDNYEKFPKSTLRPLQSLSEYGYINFQVRPILYDERFCTDIDFSITPQGETYIWKSRRDFTRVTVPDIVSWVLSGIAIAVSVISLSA
ncbi:MAG: hypothetical protein LIO86_10100 [Lachnospiraceae bacterium]|nr:hypothetical protein [Lachnospiraceae bacterium]